MKALYVCLAIFLASPVFADGQFDCGDLAGSWQGERFDQEMGAQQTSVVTFYQNGFVVFDYAYNNGSETVAVREYARWRCDADVLSLDYSDYDDSGRIDDYELAELNSSYVVYRRAGFDDGGVRYEMTKLPESLYGQDESCGC